VCAAGKIVRGTPHDILQLLHEFSTPRITRHPVLCLPTPACARPSGDVSPPPEGRRHVAFYVEEHNTSMPHSAFQGQTPDEMYFGRGDGIPDRLAEARALARERRMEENRARQCAVCA
jgi:hypothetical protein